MEPPRFIENRTFDEIAVGDTASLTRTLQAQDISLFALASGDVNPAHLDRDYAATDRFHGVIAHGLWGGSLISAVLGTELPAKEYHTIGGMVMARLRHIPQEGEYLDESGYRFTVEKATERSIVKLRVERK